MDREAPQERIVIPAVGNGPLFPASRYDPTVRPLAGASGYGIPRRGVESHGFDSDSTLEDYSPDQSGEQSDPTESYNVNIEIDPVDPVPVTVVNLPMVQNIKNGLYRTFIDGRFISPASVAAPFAPLTTQVLAIAPRDPSRVALTVFTRANWRVAGANQAAMYQFAIGNDAGFADGTYIVLPDNSPMVRIETTEPVYAAIVPILNYDITKENTQLLMGVIETASLIKNNPAAPVVLEMP